MYAKRKKWDLKSVKVHVVYNKIYAKDCGHCVESDLKGLNGNDRLDHIDRILEIEGDLDEKQRERLKLIANKCPVHRTLENKVVIHTKLKPSAIDHADVAASR
jgi:putative redox protein